MFSTFPPWPVRYLPVLTRSVPRYYQEPRTGAARGEGGQGQGRPGHASPASHVILVTCTPIFLITWSRPHAASHVTFVIPQFSTLLFAPPACASCRFPWTARQHSLHSASAFPELGSSVP
eukprot:3260305-Rhodomonas_salina.2